MNKRTLDSRIACLLLLAASACTQTADAAKADTLAAGTADVSVSADAVSDGVADVPPADIADTADTAIADTPCTQACVKLMGCTAMSQATCIAKCADPNPCATTCITGSKTCEDAADCLGAWMPLASFSDGPYGSKWRSIADDFDLPLLTDDDATTDWTFLEHFNGRDSFVFFFTAKDFKYAADLWKGNVKNWLKGSPRNVHYFFLTYADAKTTDAAQAVVTAMQANINKSLAKLDAYSQCVWRPRIHFVAEPVNGLSGALLKTVQAVGGVAAVGLDRFQRWRQIGMLSLVGGQPDLGLVDYEVRHWNFEWDREIALKKENATLLPLHQAKDGGSFTLDVEFPGAAEMAKFDTMQFDLSSSCKDHDDKNCNDWDYVSAVFLCERPTQTTNPDADTACQPAVAEIAAVAEKAGVCTGGATACKADADCDKDVKCLGYVAPVTPVKGVAADQKSCSCLGVDNATVVPHVKTCKGDGKGYGDCPCACPVEMGRWITSYKREGRWVSDATPFLAFFKQGGKHRIHFDASNFPLVDFDIRLSSRATGTVPVNTMELFTSPEYGFNQTYNEHFKPKTVHIPVGTKKVKLFALITGHGFGADMENCAEFCNHTHHFGLNDQEFVKDQPFAGLSMGCAEQAEQGSIPNQYGTWNYGRGGWCPGMDVKPFDVDVTAAAKIGSDNTFTYKGLFNGENYTPVANTGPNGGGFGALIRMRSWLVFYQ